MHASVHVNTFNVFVFVFGSVRQTRNLFIISGTNVTSWARASIGGDGGRVSPLFRVGDSIEIVPPPLFS